MPSRKPAADSVEVLAIDPGGTTGLAHAAFRRGEPPKMLSHGEYSFEDLVSAVDVSYPCNVVCERYTITAETLRKSRQTTALEVIGVLRYLTLRAGTELTLQSPGDAKRFATDDRLRKVGWWHKGGGGHANDAARHLMLYAVKNGLMDAPR